MVRNYKRKTEQNSSKEKEIQDALRMVQEGKLSIRKAAKEARVHEKTLRNRIKEKNKKMSGQMDGSIGCTFPKTLCFYMKE